MIRFILVCGWFISIPWFGSSSLHAQPVETAHVVAKDGLSLAGRVEATDPKIKVVVADGKAGMLPGKRFLVKMTGGKSFRLTLESADIDSFLIVQDLAGTQIAYDDDSGGGLNSAVSLTVPADATYQVHAASLKGAGAFALKVRETGSFTVHQLGKNGLTLEDRVDAMAPKIPVMLPNNKRGALPAKSFVVKLTGGKNYRMTVDSPDIDSVLVVQDQSGRQIAFDDDSGGGLNSALTLAVSADTCYQLHGATLKGTGAFVLKVRETSILKVADVVVGKVHEVGKGLKIDDGLGKEPAKVYSVKLTAGTTYVIDMTSRDPKTLDPYLRLGDANWKMIAEDDDGGGSRNARIVHRIELTGTYSIAAMKVGPGTGRFILDVREATAADGMGEKQAQVTEALKLAAQAKRFFDQEDYLKAETIYRKVVELHERGLGKKHPDYAKCVDSLGLIYYRLGETGKAEAQYREAVELRKQILGDKHPDTATSMNNLAHVYRDQGKYPEAEATSRQVVELRKEILGEKNPVFAESVGVLAGIYRHMGKYSEALALAHRVVDLREEIHGAKHPDFAASLNNLALVYFSQQNYTKAEPIYRRALDLRKEILGTKHVDYRQSLHNLAVLYRDRADYKEAESLYLEELESCKQADREKHLDGANSLNSLAILYQSMKEYAKAESYFHREMDILKQVRGERSTRYAECLNDVARLYRDRGDYPKSESAYQQALKLRKELLGEQHPDYASSLGSLASLYTEEGRFAQAEPLCRQAAAIRKKTFGPRHPKYATSLNQLAHLYFRLDDFAKAALLVDEALAVNREVFGEYHPEYATGLSNLAFLHSARGDHAKAETLYRQVLEIRQHGKGEDRKEYASSLNDLANSYRKRGDYANAEPLYLEALERRRKIFGEQHPDYAAGLIALAQLYGDQGRYAKAEPLLRDALGIHKQVYGEKHAKYLEVLNDVASFYREQADYAKAEVLYQQALELTKQIFGDRHPKYARRLNNLALNCHDRGDSSKAELLLRQAMAICKDNHDERSSEYAVFQSNLASVYHHQGNSAKAEPLYRQALDLRKKLLGEKHVDYAMSLNNFAEFYSEQADYVKAEMLHRQAFEIRKIVLGDRHPRYVESVFNLAALYRQQENFGKAEPLYREALELTRSIRGEKHPHYSMCLIGLADLYNDINAFAKAEPLYREALELRRQVVGDKHLDYALNLNNLAGLYHTQKQFAKAESLLQQALEIHKSHFGENHPAYATSLNNLATHYVGRGELAKAKPLARQALVIVTEHLAMSAAAQTEQAQLTYLSKHRTMLDIYLSCVTDRADDAEAIYDVLLPLRGAVTARQQLMRLASFARVDGDPTLRQLFAQLQTVSRDYARLAQAPINPAVTSDLKKQLVELTQRREVIEIDLSQRTDAFRQSRQSRRMQSAQLRAALPAGVALVDFLVYQRDDPVRKTNDDHLVAFVVTPKAVRCIQLGSTARLAKEVDAFRGQMTRQLTNAEAASPGQLLRQRIWQPLMEEVADAKLILIAPDGPLCRLPFAALPSADGKRYLIEETAVAVLPVPQLLPELLASQTAKSARISLLAMGGIDFDADPKAQPHSLPDAVVAVNRRPTEDVRAGKALHWGDLPGAHAEVAYIQNAFKKEFPEGQLTVLSKSSATTAAFRQHASAHQYLHLATHGFFADSWARSALQGGTNDVGRVSFTDTKSRAPVGFHPGLLSGLVLAGANKANADDDGILTALEVAELDLNKVELAVLSACETGLGETAGGEGVLGLQRAFQIAGARTTVTSLWKVSDEATRTLMERFYVNRWKKNLGPLEALRQAQLSMLRGELPRGRDLPRGAERDDEVPGERRAIPYYWAAFVLSGDWR